MGGTADEGTTDERTTDERTTDEGTTDEGATDAATANDDAATNCAISINVKHYHQDGEDYTGSLRPTTTGSLIRQTGDVIFTQAGQNEQEMEQVELRPTSKGNVKDNIRQSGVFVGI